MTLECITGLTAEASLFFMDSLLASIGRMRGGTGWKHNWETVDVHFAHCHRTCNELFERYYPD